MELEPPKSQLDSYELHGRSLSDWHEWLVTNQETGEDERNARVPCSRYGHWSEDCAWWAIACEVIYVEANGEDDDVEVSLNHLMGLVVNDHDDVARLVFDYWYCLPAALKVQLGSHQQVGELL